VLTSYDPQPWRGVYSVATNKLTELADNQGNVCKYHAPADDYGVHRLPIDEFDWGNPYITNCLVDDAKWYIDYGVTPYSGIDRVELTGGSVLDLRGWTGGWLAHFIISNFSTVDFSNGNMDVEEVTVNGGFIHVNSDARYNFIFLCTISDSAFVDASSDIDSDLYMEGCFIQGYSGVYHNVPGSLSLFATAVTAFGEVCMDTGGSIADVAIDNSTITGTSGYTGRESGIYITGTNTGDVYFTDVHVSSGATIHVNDAASTISIYDTSVDTFGLLRVPTSGTIDVVKVSQGTLNSGGYDLTGVYLLGSATKTATANNTNKGKDYFNDNIT
jgi:hypothetical protein